MNVRNESIPDSGAPPKSIQQKRSIKSLALITSQAYSIANFRGPLITAFITRGVRVYALAPDYNSQTREAVEALGAEPVDFSLERTGMRPIRDLLDLFRLVLLLQKLKPDATLGYFIKPVIYGSVAAKLAGVPHRYSLVAGLGYVFISEGKRDNLKRRFLRGLALKLYKMGFKACDHVFFQNNDDIEYFVRNNTIIQRKTIRLNGTGIDLEKLRPTPLNESPTTFLLMARLLREKGICEYVEAARIIKDIYPQTQFILLGGLDPNPGCLSESEIMKWVGEGLIVWPGHVNDVQPWIAQSSVYVLPSYREGVPRSTQEAMAMGRPVITTDAVGCRDTVEDGVNGFLVPVRDSDALAKAMLRFIENPSLIKSMGRESRRLAEERFDVHKINAIMLGAMGISPS